MSLSKTLKTLKTLARTPDLHSRFPPSLGSLPAVPLSPLPSPTSPTVPFSLSRGGPLSLSSLPWKFSRCTNPVYMGRRVVKLPGGLMEVRSLPLGLDFSSVAEGRRNDRRFVSEKKKTPALDADSTGINEKFLNLPNLVSISRMVSGPVIGWYC